LLYTVQAMDEKLTWSCSEHIKLKSYSRAIKSKTFPVNWTEE